MILCTLKAKQYFQTININDSVSWVKGGGVSLLQAPELLINVNFEPIIRGLKSVKSVSYM